MKRSILTEKVARRGYHVVREYSVSPLARFRVEDVMERDVVTIPAMLPTDSIFRRLIVHDPVVGRGHSWPLVDESGRFVGIVTRSDLLHAFDKDGDGDPCMVDIATTEPVVAHPDEPLEDALERMLRCGVGRLPVVDREDPTALVGMLTRDSATAAYRMAMEEETLPERRERVLEGWLS
jgi:CBS domain-containing protein